MIAFVNEQRFMKVTIQTPGFTSSEKLNSFVEENVNKLSNYYQPIIECRVVLKTDASDTKENKVAEVRLVIAGNDLFASKQTASFEESVKLSVDALKHQIEKLKTQRENKR